MTSIPAKGRQRDTTVAATQRRAELPMAAESAHDRHRMPGRTADYLDMLFADHGIFRLPYLNMHRLGDKAWRSAQPAPHDIARFARRGIRTLINLRGPRNSGSDRLEREACKRHGIAVVDFKISSRKAPTFDAVKVATALFECVNYPFVMHCKSGADRTGLVSVLYCHLREGVPIEKAKKHLSPLYGHFRWSRAGMVDAFFDRYLEHNRRTPMPFLEWAEKVYDPAELTQAFNASRRINWPGFGDD